MKSFRIDEEYIEQLTRITEFYSKAQLLDGFLPGKKFSEADIISFLIDKEFKSLQEQEFEV